MRHLLPLLLLVTPPSLMGEAEARSRSKGSAGSGAAELKRVLGKGWDIAPAVNDYALGNIYSGDGVLEFRKADCFSAEAQPSPSVNFEIEQAMNARARVGLGGVKSESTASASYENPHIKRFSSSDKSLKTD